MTPSALDLCLQPKVCLPGVFLKPWTTMFQVQIIVLVFRQQSIEQQNLLIVFVQQPDPIARPSYFAYLVEMLVSPHLKQLSLPGLIACLFQNSLSTLISLLI